MKQKTFGFTLFEIIIVLAIFMLSIAGLSVPVLKFLNNSQLDATAQGIIHKLKIAQSNAQMNLQSSKWGVFLDDSEENPGYVFFRGSAKDQYPSSQESYTFPETVEFQNITLSQGGSSIVFDERSGNTPYYGSFQLTHSNMDTIYTISINPLGIIELDY